ncbi:MAG: AtpZ/AtpI family protein, partial [Mailhella sp.]|nr:AtpZ/AtpI family protein [Mailhella sp.]
MAEKSTEKSPGAFSLLGTASTMGLHMVSGPIVGGGLGWLIDHWLDSWPIAASIGLLLGLAAGFRNVWADARYLERSNAVLDEERKKREEAAVKPEKSREKAREEEKSAVIAPPVPSVHKESEAAGKGMAASSSVREGGAASDALTASILAGTAASEEKWLVELDETEEAIRRFLESEGRKNEGGTSSGPEGK